MPDRTCLSGQIVYRQKRKKPVGEDGLLTDLVPGRLWQTADKQKTPCFRMRFLRVFDAWQFPTLTWGDPTLPSALRRFTSEFGMGSGGTTALSPPGKFCFHPAFLRDDLICNQAEHFVSSPKQLRRCKVKPHGSLVSVSSTYRYAYTPDLSTSSSSTFLQDSQGVRENSSRGKFRA